MRKMVLVTIKLLAALAVATALMMASPASGQPQVPPAAAACTTSLLTSFTPCFSFLTNSTNNGGAAPTADCCRSLAALVNASTGCACLVLAGNMPLGGVPVNRTLAVTLPRACSSMSVPLQCRDTSTEIPPPGPAAVTPAMPPLPPATPATPESEAPVSQGQTRPAVLPSSDAWRTSSHVSASALLLAAAAALV